MTTLQKALYRSLLRCAKTFDRDPLLKAFIVAGSPKSDNHYRKAVDRFLDNASLFRPMPTTNQSVVQAIQDEYRRPPESDGSPATEAAAHRSREDSAFHALRNLHRTLSFARENIDQMSSNEGASSRHAVKPLASCHPGESSEDEKWIRNASGRVSRQYTPSPGFLLVSNPVQAGWLERSAVLITHTSLINGSQGLVLNRQIHMQRQEDAKGSASETDDEEVEILHVHCGHNENGSSESEANEGTSHRLHVVPLNLTGVATLPKLSAGSHDDGVYGLIISEQVDEDDEPGSGEQADEACATDQEESESDPSIEEIRKVAKLGIVLQDLKKLQGDVEDMCRRILPHTMSQLGNEQQLMSKQQTKSRATQKVFLGGPVDDDSLTYLHSKPALGGVALANTPLHVGLGQQGSSRGDATERRGRNRRRWKLTPSKMATKHRAEVALYFGKCEWGGMQLENEIADGRWLMFAIHPDALIRPPDLGESSPWYHRLPTWSAILNAAGEPYKQLPRISPAANFAKELYIVE